MNPDLRNNRAKVLGFTLVEMLVVIAILAILASILLPVISRSKAQGRGVACLSNLRQIGVALQMYVDENGNRMPIMHNRGTNSTPVVTNAPNEVLHGHLSSPGIFACPSDNEGWFMLTGASYDWNNLLNGKPADKLTMLGIDFGITGTPLFADRENFHSKRGQGKERNYLYADGHVKNLLLLGGSL